METGKKPGAPTVPKTSGAPPQKKSDPVPNQKMLGTKELLRMWLDDPDLDHVVLIGLPKQGGWKYAYSNGDFEFLSAAETVVQKLKLIALDIGPLKK